MAALLELLIAFLKGLPILNQWVSEPKIDKILKANHSIDEEARDIENGAPPLSDNW